MQTCEIMTGVSPMCDPYVWTWRVNLMRISPLSRYIDNLLVHHIPGASLVRCKHPRTHWGYQYQLYGVQDFRKAFAVRLRVMLPLCASHTPCASHVPPCAPRAPHMCLTYPMYRTSERHSR